ncbi:MAG TPA: hypothetical protein VFZ61_24730, partial [Polyangiales bacterium]
MSRHIAVALFWCVGWGAVAAGQPAPAALSVVPASRPPDDASAAVGESRSGPFDGRRFGIGVV